MKSAFIWIVVCLRVVAVSVAAFGLFSTCSMLVLDSSRGSGLSVSMGLVGLLMRLLLVYLLSAGVMWFASKPVARLILRDLDRE